MHWDTHNLLTPSVLAANDLTNVGNSSEYVLLGHVDTLRKCQERVRGLRETNFHSFTYTFPSHRKPALRGACFGVASPRWEPSITGDAVSGRLLCAANQEYVVLQAANCPSVMENDFQRSRSSDAAIIVLAAGGVHSTAAAKTVTADLTNLFTHSQDASATADVLVFHDGSIMPRERKELCSHFPRLSTILLNQAMWRTPLELALAERFYKQAYTDTLSPRDTARWLGFRFWSKLIFVEARRRGYDWVLRLGRGSRIHSTVQDDIFATMRARNAAYGFRMMGCELIRRADLFRLVQRTLRVQRVEPIWLLDGCERRTRVLDYHRDNCAVDSMLPGAFQACYLLSHLAPLHVQC